MKVIIADTRNLTDYNLLKEYCDQILSNQSGIKIVSGGARGADSYASNTLTKKVSY